MDFRTEWSSWLLVLLMIAITIYVYPYVGSPESGIGDVLFYILQILSVPFVLITLASIPVLIVCWFVKVIPDIDYSIRTAFAIMLVLFLWNMMG